MKINITEISKRKYIAIGNEAEQIFEIEFDFYELVKIDENGSEVFYALQEKTDEILDLKNGESLFFQANRDSVKDKGIILRIQ